MERMSHNVGIENEDVSGRGGKVAVCITVASLRPCLFLNWIMAMSSIFVVDQVVYIVLF